MARCKDMVYSFAVGAAGTPINLEHCKLALLMDLRDELKENNELQRRILAVLECNNTRLIPTYLKRIDRRLAKKIPLK